ncbi:MAG: signal recognition particle-docking protein FtsY [Myxococcales bacterium]|nr:signal recognition particle-docking protein FtsY [Myxococcales bacterium]
MPALNCAALLFPLAVADGETLSGGAIGFLVAVAVALLWFGVVVVRKTRPPQLPSTQRPTQDSSHRPLANDSLPIDPQIAARHAERAFLRSGLAKTKDEGFIGRLAQLFGGKHIDAAVLEEIEEVLLRADLGTKTTQKLLTDLRAAVQKGGATDPAALWATLRQHAERMLLATTTGKASAALVLPAERAPAVLMVVGVNGSGKTTTIGKLAHRFAGQGRKVLVAAGDTYRAAAVDQLDVWCQRAGVPLHRGKDNADPASVCFAAIERGRAEGFDLVIVDTAGRLHTNHNLMEELKKVGRVVAKAHPGAPDEVLLVLDATMGQNAVKQAELFKEAVAVTGIALTKLDGTAKGGVVLAIAEGMGLPVKLIGVGEKMQDLRDFDPQLFVDEMFSSTPGSTNT